MKTLKNDGFAGLLVMLIVTLAIMALIMWKSGFFEATKEMKGETKGAPAQPGFEVLQEAKDLKTSIEQKYR